MRFLSATIEYTRLTVLFLISSKYFVLSVACIRDIQCMYKSKIWPECLPECLDVREWFSACPLVSFVPAITMHLGVCTIQFPNSMAYIHRYVGVQFPDIVTYIRTYRHISLSRCPSLTSPVPTMCPLGVLVYSAHSHLLSCNSISCEAVTDSPLPTHSPTPTPGRRIGYTC